MRIKILSSAVEDLHAVYYTLASDMVVIFRVLDLRRDPARTHHALRSE
jgi:hypothetical protein